MKTSKWTNRIAGFVVGLLVAFGLSFALPRNQASPAELDIYQRMSAVEKDVAGLQSWTKSHDKAEADERRRQQAADRIR